MYEKNISGGFNNPFHRTRRMRQKKVDKLSEINSTIAKTVVINGSQSLFNRTYSDAMKRIRHEVELGQMIEDIEQRDVNVKKQKEKEKQLRENKVLLEKEKADRSLVQKTEDRVRIEQERYRERERDRSRDRERERERDRSRYRGPQYPYNGGFKKSTKKKLSKKKSPKVHTGPRGGKYIIKRGKKIYQ